ncbi:MAG: tyrosine--tRNA ligase [Nitrososphaerota archaeon]
MNIEEKIKIIKSPPTIEIINEEELQKVLEEKEHPITYCGYETSGPIHLGHLIAIKKQIDLQKIGLIVKVLWPDLHTFMNRKGSLEWIHKMQEYSQHCFIACGLDPQKTIFIQGSDFELDKKYIEDFMKLSLHITISRAKRSMTIVGRKMEDARVSQIVYPVFQCLDIAYLDVDIAHGGMDQRKIHMLAREFLPEIGYKKPVCLHTAILTSLTGPGEKMSSSKPETFIAIHDPPEVIEEKIMKAYCPAKEIINNPIIEICNYIIFPYYQKLEVERPSKYGGKIIFYSFKELKEEFEKGKLHPLDLKKAVLENLIKILEPIRKYFNNKTEILNILKQTKRDTI